MPTRLVEYSIPYSIEVYLVAVEVVSKLDKEELETEQEQSDFPKFIQTVGIMPSRCLYNYNSYVEMS